MTAGVATQSGVERMLAVTTSRILLSLLTLVLPEPAAHVFAISSLAHHKVPGSLSLPYATITGPIVASNETVPSDLAADLQPQPQPPTDLPSSSPAPQPSTVVPSTLAFNAKGM